ncbi:condensation domain-containing protein, partial [Alkalimonas amylolytica]
DAFNRLVMAVEFVIRRHDVLRTMILWRERAQPVQVVVRHAELPVRFLRQDEVGCSKEAVQSYIKNAAFYIDLELAPLIQLEVIKDNHSERSYVVIKTHHIISDHISLEVLMDDMSAYSQGYAERLPKAPLYREFIARTLHHLGGLDVAGFFKEQLAVIEGPTLPFGLFDVMGDGSRVNDLNIPLSASVSAKIRELMRLHTTSPATFFHAVWALVLSACTGQQHVAFGTVFTGRMSGGQGVERAMGMLINTLPLVVSVNERPAKGFLQSVSQSLKDLMPYEQVSLSEAQSYSSIAGSLPLFNSVINYRHSIASEEEPVEVEVSPSGAGISMVEVIERTNYPLTISVNDFGESHPFSLSLQVDEALDGQTIADYAVTAISSLLSALERGDDTAVNLLNILPEQERYRQIFEMNTTALDYPQDKCIHELFEQQAEDNPDAIAVV